MNVLYFQEHQNPEKDNKEESFRKFKELIDSVPLPSVLKDVDDLKLLKYLGYKE